MGVLQGSNLVKPFFQKMTLRAALSKAFHDKFAVDVSGLLHRKLSHFAAYVVADDWEEFDSAVEAECASLSVTLPGTTVVFVFDGRRVSAKKANESRQAARHTAAERLRELVIERDELATRKMQLLNRTSGGDADGPSHPPEGLCPSSGGLSNDELVQKLGNELEDVRKAIKTMEVSVAAGLSPAATHRAIAICRRRGFQYVVAPGEAEHQMRTMQAAGHVGAVCGYDTDFFAMGCDKVIYGNSLTREVNYMDWKYADDSIAQRDDITFVSEDAGHRQLNINLTQAMRTYGVKLVVQLSSLFLKNDYGACGIRLISLAKVWGSLLSTASAADDPPTIATFAECAAGVIKQASDPRHILLTAERAAFMYHCQVALLETEDGGCQLVAGDLPPFASGCTSKLLKPRRRAQDGAASSLKVYQTQRPADLDVLDQQNFFSQLSHEKLRTWLQGGYSVLADTPSELQELQLPAADDIPESVTAALAVAKLKSYLSSLSHVQLKAVAWRLDIPVSQLKTHDLRKTLELVINLHHRSMPIDALGAMLETEATQVAVLNKEKDVTSKACRQEFASAPHRLSLKEPDAYAFIFKCDEKVLMEWQDMAPLPSIGASKRSREGRLRATAFKELAVSSCGDIGYIDVRVQASMPVDYFYNVVVKVALESVSRPNHADLCVDRSITRILSVKCLLPEGVVDGDGHTKKVPGTQRAASIVNDHRFCFGGSFCLHCTAALYGLHFATVPSTTDKPGYWVEPGMTLSRSLAAVVGMPIFNFVVPEKSDAADAAYFNSLTVEDCEYINAGVGPHGDPHYRTALLALRDAVRDATGADAFRIDAVLFGPSHEAAPVVYGNGAIPRDRKPRSCDVPATQSDEQVGNVQDNVTTMDTTADQPEVVGVDICDGSAQPPAKCSKRWDRRDGPRTRRVASKQRSRDARVCACVNPSCVIDPEADGPRSVRIPSSVKEQWLRHLGHSGPSLASKISKEELFVNPGHFGPEAFEFHTARGDWRLAASPDTYTPTLKASPLSQELLQRSRERNAAFRGTCICALPDCLEVLDAYNSVGLCINLHNSWTVDEAELRLLRGQQPPQETRAILRHLGKREIRVAARHFAPGTLRHTKDGKLQRKKGARASLMRAEDVPRRSSPQDRRETGRGRQHLTSLGIPVFPSDDLNQRLGQSVLKLEESNRAFDISEQPEEKRASVQRRADFMTQLESSAEQCRRFTGMHNHKVLLAHFNYFNARKALNNLTMWHGSVTRKVGNKDVRGRRAVLTPFEAYVLFNVVLWKGMSDFVPYAFGVSMSTAQRTFRTLLPAVAYIGGKHQPYPSADAMQKYCSAEARELLQLNENTIILKGDATEWRLQRPTQIHSAMYSEYKRDHTGKFNAMVTCDGYMVEITRAYSGRTTDNQLHTAENMGKRIKAAAGHYTPVLLYDKGLNRIQELSENGVILVRPTGKAANQLTFHQSDIEMNKIICSLRVTIENTFREMRTFKSFGHPRRVCEIADIDLIASAVRCFINLRPVRKKTNGVEDPIPDDVAGETDDVIGDNV